MCIYRKGRQRYMLTAAANMHTVIGTCTPLNFKCRCVHCVWAPHQSQHVTQQIGCGACENRTTNQPTDRPTDHPSNQPTRDCKPTNHPPVHGCFTTSYKWRLLAASCSGLAVLVGLKFGWLVGWVAGFGGWFRWLVGWLVGWLVLPGWLAGWLVG